MITAREQRNKFLRSIGMDEKGLNRSVKKMVEKDCLRAEGKLLKKRKSRRATAEWKRRQKFNG
jgi:hypothetical protein